MGIFDLLPSPKSIYDLLPSPKSIYEKGWKFGTYLTGIGLTSATAFIILYLPLIVSQDQEKYAMQRLLGTSFGFKLDANQQQQQTLQ